jgi:glycine C-acetyltransferase
MAHERFDEALRRHVEAVDSRGIAKRHESVITDVVSPRDGRGPRVRLRGEHDRTFLRMNSNGYLGLALREELAAAEERAVRRYGTGPGAVRFISGTYEPHVSLEHRLARFHGREAAMLFSSAYGTTLGVLPPLVTPETAVVSDELNHNCIINATRLAQPATKVVYRHLDLDALAQALESVVDGNDRVLVVTDGVFSMRGDHAPLDAIAAVIARFDQRVPENIVLVVDDSHGVGAFGASGRGTEEVTGTRADVLIATLGKAIGVNGGYVAGSQVLIDLLRETSATYVYSNPITPAEAAAAEAAIDVLDGPAGRALLGHLRAMTARLEAGIVSLGYETIPGGHPVVPVVLRDSDVTVALVWHLRASGILATGLAYPVVPRGAEEIRFQVSADHTEGDIDEVLAALASFPAADSRRGG